MTLGFLIGEPSTVALLFIFKNIIFHSILSTNMKIFSEATYIWLDICTKTMQDPRLGIKPKYIAKYHYMIRYNLSKLYI